MFGNCLFSKRTNEVQNEINSEFGGLACVKMRKVEGEKCSNWLILKIFENFRPVLLTRNEKYLIFRKC